VTSRQDEVVVAVASVVQRIQTVDSANVAKADTNVAEDLTENSGRTGSEP